MKCNVCKKTVEIDCDYNQGRCPHRKPMLNIQPRDTSRGHFYVSIVKSIFRLAAGGSLIAGNLFAAGLMLILAEFLGIVEELV